MPRARAIGINHVALEVGDVDEALAFYGRLFAFELRGRAGDHMVVLDLGDQFLALSAPRHEGPDADRHFGLVVDDLEAVRAALEEAGVTPEPGRGLRFQDPWGNQVEVVDYRRIQFTKAGSVLAGMGLGDVEKTADALDELRAKGLA